MLSIKTYSSLIGLDITLRPRQNGRHFPDDIFKWIFLKENVWISIKISLKFVPKVPINNIPALALITAWCRSGDKPLSEPMMDNLLTHICVTRPQWDIRPWPWYSFLAMSYSHSVKYQSRCGYLSFFISFIFFIYWFVNYAFSQQRCFDLNATYRYYETPNIDAAQ